MCAAAVHRAGSPPSGRHRKEPTRLCTKQSWRGRVLWPPSGPGAQPGDAFHTQCPPTPDDRPLCRDPAPRHFLHLGAARPGQCLGDAGGRTRPPSPPGFFSPCILSTGLPCLKQHGRCGLPCTRRQQITVAPCPPSILQHRAYLMYLDLSLRRTWLWGYRCATGPWPGRDGCLPSAARHSGV